MSQENESSSLDALAILVEGKSKPALLESPFKDIAPLQISIRREGVWSAYTTARQECRFGDKICFQIHTYPNGHDAIDVRNRLILKRRDKNDRVSYTVHVIVSATGFPDLNSAVNVDVLGNTNVQIICRSFDWYTRKTKQKHANLKRDLNEKGNPRKIFSDEGVLLGNLSNKEKSNLLVYFDVVEK